MNLHSHRAAATKICAAIPPVLPVTSVVTMPNSMIWSAFDDPEVSDEDFVALVRSIHGPDLEEEL